MRAVDLVGVVHDYTDGGSARDGGILCKTFCGQEFPHPWTTLPARVSWRLVILPVTCPECAASPGPKWRRRYTEHYRRHEAERLGVA